MKKIILGLVGGMLALTAITSCKKLDLAPYDAVDVTTGFTNVLDAKYWDAGIYTQFRGRQYGTYTTLQEVQGDQLNASLDFGNRLGANHRWGSFLQSDAVAGPYQAYYSGIANLNVIIKGFESIVPLTSVQTDSLNNYKADARIVRAFYYNQLMLRYAKAYNPATATADLGVPLVTEYDILAKPSRATSKAVYDQILADITIAKALNKRPNRVGSRYFTPDAILALEARVRLYVQDWAGAYTAAQTLITSARYPLYNSAATIKSYWTNDTFQEDIFRIPATLTETVNTNAIYLGLNQANAFYAPDFFPTQAVVDSYSATDFRKATYFVQGKARVQGIDYANVYMVNKFPGNPNLFTAPPQTNYQNANKILRIGEIYAIAAEAAFNAGSEPNAITALTALQVARGVVTPLLAGTALRDEIRAERTRELNFEGFHLWDLKRWGLGFTRGTPQNTAFVGTTTGFSGLTIAATDQKFVWAFPSNDIILNSNLSQNPGW